MTTMNLIRSEILLNKQFCAQICARTKNFVHKFVLEQTILCSNLCWSNQFCAQICAQQTILFTNLCSSKNKKLHKFVLKKTIFCTNLCLSKQFCAKICARANNIVHKFVLEQTILCTNLCSSKKTGSPYFISFASFNCLHSSSQTSVRLFQPKNLSGKNKSSPIIPMLL